MFSPEDRARVRFGLLAMAERDDRITGAAITGSAADSREDQWSDVDLAFGVGTDANIADVLADWTAHVYEHHGALHHLDVLSGAWTYRVFLLANSLQVDLAFVHETEFRPLAPTFRLVSGKAQASLSPSSPAAGPIIGMAWLYALHARSCLGRGRLWQAEYMISGMRDSALTLACLRHALPSAHGRGIDLLPATVKATFEESLVRQLSLGELSRSFEVAIRGLLHEIRCADAELGARLAPALTQLAVWE